MLTTLAIAWWLLFAGGLERVFYHVVGSITVLVLLGVPCIAWLGIVIAYRRWKYRDF